MSHSFVRSRRLLVLIGLAAIAFFVSPTCTSARPPSPDRILLQSGDAYIIYNENSQTWEIGTAGIRRRMDYTAGGGYRLLSFENRLTKHEWLAPNSSSSALHLGLDGQIITGLARDFTLWTFTTGRHPDGSLELEVILTRGPVIAHLHYVAFPGTSILEQWAEVENGGDTALHDLTALDSISIELSPSADPLTLYWVQGLNPNVSDETIPQKDPILRVRSKAVTEGETQIIGSNGRSSEESMGWFALASPSLREGMFGGIEWSGAWDLRATRSNGRTKVEAGLQGIRKNLEPGEIFQAPRRFIGFYSGDLDSAANASHAFARTYLMRQPPVDFPWAQYNTWFAYYTDLEEGRLRTEVDHAAEMGLELFYIDAGWYEGSPSDADFSWGLGTWRENRAKFPSGLAAFSDYVHSKGMKFGLWVEPERVDLDYVGPGKEIPREWLAPGTAFDAKPPEGLPQSAMVCLSHPEAREWMKTWLARIVRDYKLDWLKWDNNMWVTCDPPGQVGLANYEHVLGLYEVLDFLRQEFPNLIIEDCASGGNRMDYALMRRTDIAWLSDQTDPSYRVRYHIYGASYPFPPEYLNSWLVESWFEHLADGEKDPPLLRAWLRSRMMGAFGLSVSTLGWSPQLLSDVAQAVTEYKGIRSIIATGTHYHLSPQTDLEDPNLAPPTQIEVAEFYDPKTGRAAVLIFRGTAESANRNLLLEGLERDTTYDVSIPDSNTTLQRTGAQLMTVGIALPRAQNYPSTLLYLEPVGASQ